MALETKVWILPYEESSIDKNMFVQATGKSIEVTSVPQYESSLIKITLPDGHFVIAKASQIITAIQKCTM